MAKGQSVAIATIEQATGQVTKQFESAIHIIDAQFTDGYALRNPHLVAAVLGAIVEASKPLIVSAAS